MKTATAFALAATMAFGLTVVGSVSPTQAGEHTRPPLGLQVFCLKNPDECRGGGKGKVTLTDDLMATLKKVNRAVNGAITPRNESNDVWTIGPVAGDCEDYVMTKRSRLIKMGVQPAALRVAYVKTRSGEDHAVLVVRTSAGDLVLDNLTGAVKPVAQTGLRFIAMSGTKLMAWSAV